MADLAATHRLRGERDDALAPKGRSIPPRFRDTVRNYVFQFHARLVSPSFPAPPLFVLLGPPGEGKSSMVVEVLTGMGVSVRQLSASALAGMYEGDSTTPIIDACLALGSRTELLPAPALVLDDFDLSAARVDQRNAGTINQSLLNGMLMNMADKPDQVTKTFVDEAGSSRSKTFPIKPVMMVLTANDGSQLYPPLLRPGRALLAEWKATPDEMAMMLQGIFPSLSEQERRILVGRFPGFPIAFFNQVNSEMVRAQVESVAGALGDDALVNRARMLAIVSDWTLARSHRTLEEITERAAELRATRRAITNHIASGGRQHAHNRHARPA